MKVLPVLLLLILPLSMVIAQDEEPEGDDKILETIRKIEEETEREAGGGDSYDEDDSDSECCNACFDGCIWFLDSGGAELLWQYFISLRFAPYPYAPDAAYDFSSLDYGEFSNHKVTSLQLGADLSTHFDGTYANTNRLTAQLTALHLNVFNQTLFGRTVPLSTVSINAGLSLVIGGFDLSAFAGTYLITTTGTFLFSTGLSSRVFLPGRIFLDVYGLYAFLSSDAGILHLLASVNWAIHRFSIGVGYNYNLYDYSLNVDDVYQGPCLKVGFWL
jgi:hypothetical protein